MVRTLVLAIHSVGTEFGYEPDVVESKKVGAVRPLRIPLSDAVISLSPLVATGLHLGRRQAKPGETKKLRQKGN